MADQEEAVREPMPSERMQDFIFHRELAEVYLLLDYLSGRSNQSLAAALADDKGGKVSIEEICNISWPPAGSKLEQAKQAATLLLAKDKLNMTAKPASGESIAFTLLVAGDDGTVKARRQERHEPRGWFGGLFSRRSQAPPTSASRVPQGGGPTPAAPVPPAPPPAAPATGGGGPTPPPSGGGGGGDNAWSSGAPSRTSLARLAYPGLIGRAGRFYYGTIAIIILLFVWLILTCLLSWNVAAGRAIVSRLDAVEKDRATIDGKIEKAEVGPVQAQTDASQAPNPAPAQQGAGSSGNVLRYCERYLVLEPVKTADGKVIRQFQTATQRQLCDQLVENRVLYGSGCEHVSSWLALWRFFRIESPEKQDACVSKGASVTAASISEHQRASVLVEILATAVLPIFYGFLGAGAAAVRDIWSKMRDCLLLPRDMTLSVGRLALGAVIGACIGLFVSPSGTAGQTGTALTTAVTLTPSALSFIAGFGVEGIFVALEGFIKRVFNTPDPK